VKLVSRAGNDLTAKYAPLVDELRRLPFEEAVVDGEIVALDEAGRSSFQLLQSYHTFGANKPPLVFYAFDLLQCDGRDLGGLPLCDRKTWLEEALADLDPGAVLFSGGIKAQSRRLIQAMQARGLEGVMAKRRDSTYLPGQRTGAWLKFKWGNEQEFVIGGYTEPQGSRSHFGAVLVGYHNGDRLIFAGKVGTGFNERLLENMWQRFQQLRRPSAPFANVPGNGAGRVLSPAEMRRCTWIEPRLVCQVRFTEWTREGILRQPSFQGLREDKDPREVVLETAARFR
jgi:bifunctional non-homologous end joining protein LigD